MGPKRLQTSPKSGRSVRGRAHQLRQLIGLAQVRWRRPRRRGSELVRKPAIYRAVLDKHLCNLHAAQSSPGSRASRSPQLQTPGAHWLRPRLPSGCRGRYARASAKKLFGRRAARPARPGARVPRLRLALKLRALTIAATSERSCPAMRTPSCYKVSTCSCVLVTLPTRKPALSCCRTTFYFPPWRWKATL